jgi:hypothetical protein
MVKALLRKDAAQDWTRTYRPTKDWSVPLEQILERLPPDALEPPGRTTRQPEGNKSSEGASRDSGNDNE